MNRIQLGYNRPITEEAANFLYAHCCLEENTRVLLADDEFRPIKDIRIGDRVATLDKGDVRVMNCWQGLEDELLELWLGDGFIRLTPSHPVQTPTGFVKAGSLKADDEVYGYTNFRRCTHKVKSIDKVKQSFMVCNLDTENNEPFIVEAGFIVGTNYAQNII
jgi:hypothetical protein